MSKNSILNKGNLTSNGDIIVGDQIFLNIYNVDQYVDLENQIKDITELIGLKKNANKDSSSHILRLEQLRKKKSQIAHSVLSLCTQIVTLESTEDSIAMIKDAIKSGDFKEAERIVSSLDLDSKLQDFEKLETNLVSGKDRLAGQFIIKANLLWLKKDEDEWLTMYVQSLVKAADLTKNASLLFEISSDLGYCEIRKLTIKTLRKAYVNAKDSVLKVSIGITLSFAIMNNDPDESKFILDKGIKRLDSLKKAITDGEYHYFLAQSYGNLGTAYRNLGNFKLAKKYYGHSFSHFTYLSQQNWAEAPMDDFGIVAHNLTNTFLLEENFKAASEMVDVSVMAYKGRIRFRGMQSQYMKPLVYALILKYETCIHLSNNRKPCYRYLNEANSYLNKMYELEGDVHMSVKIYLRSRQINHFRDIGNHRKVIELANSLLENINKSPFEIDNQSHIIQDLFMHMSFAYSELGDLQKSKEFFDMIDMNELEKTDIAEPIKKKYESVYIDLQIKLKNENE